MSDRLEEIKSDLVEQRADPDVQYLADDAIDWLIAEVERLREFLSIGREYVYFGRPVRLVSAEEGVTNVVVESRDGERITIDQTELRAR